MTETEPESVVEVGSEGGGMWDNPNQQVVRADQSGPGDTADTATPHADTGEDGLDAMTKDELLAKAQELGVTPANAGMTKDEIRAGIDAKLVGDAEP